MSISRQDSAGAALPPINSKEVLTQTKYILLILLIFIFGISRPIGCPTNWEWKDGGMLELADTTAKDKNVEENKRKKAKLLKKLKEQESLANANNAVMVRDRRRPRKSIKEMSVLNKRRRVIKNTARKEIAQQKATLESMRHIELKRYSLEARELELFVERVQKVKENKRLTMLFAKFKVSDDSDDSDGSSAGEGQNESNSTTSQQDGDQGSDTTTGDKKTESMSKLIDELNSMSNMIDYDKNPQWKYIMQGQNKEPVKKESEPSERGSPDSVYSEKNGAAMFGSRFRRNQAVEAPAELQTINRFPSIGNSKMSSRDDSEIKGYSTGGVRRCASQPSINNTSAANKQLRARRISHDVIPSMPTLYSDVELSTRENTAEEINSRAESSREESIRSKPHYHTNWREREKRGDALYSPVALSPIQSGLFSPDFVMDEDELTANYRRRINPKKFQTGLVSSTGDMEFNQAMTKMPSEPKKQVASYTGTQSIIEMQLNSKTKHIADKVQKVRNETIKEKKPPQGTKNIAQIIHQSGDGSRFVEEVQILRKFAALCNCKYLRTDPERLDERRQAYIETLLDNVAKRVQIRNKWKMGIRRVNTQGAVAQPAGVSLPVISQGPSE